MRIALNLLVMVMVGITVVFFGSDFGTKSALRLGWVLCSIFGTIGVVLIIWGLLAGRRKKPPSGTRDAPSAEVGDQDRANLLRSILLERNLAYPDQQRRCFGFNLNPGMIYTSGRPEFVRNVVEAAEEAYPGQGSYMLSMIASQADLRAFMAVTQLAAAFADSDVKVLWLPDYVVHNRDDKDWITLADWLARNALTPKFDRPTS